MKKAAALAIVVILLVFGLCGCTSSKKTQIDRAYLISLMDQYIAGLIKHDPTGVPLAQNAKFVENIQATQIGQGLWKTITGGPTKFKVYVADPKAGTIGFMGVIQNAGKPALLGARLKVVDGKITEIDHMVSPLNGQIPATLQKPRPGLVTKLADSERIPRDQMLKSANSYYDAIEFSDGKIAPFADESQRRENGSIACNNQEPPPPGNGTTTSNSMTPFGKLKCSDQLSTGIMGYITRINQRRLFAVDEEMGLVMAFSMFNHDGEPDPLKIKNMPGITESPNKWGKFTVPAAHIYKIKNGKIYEIEAMAIVGVPYQASNGWNCTRKCLADLMDQYLAALPKHDTSAVPLAQNVKLVENTKPTPIGEGLWKTATGGPTTFKIITADPDREEVGFMGVIEENNKPAIAAIRLKLVDGKITEIDHLVVHPNEKPLNANMSKLRPAFIERLPKLERIPRDKMLEIANSYYESLIQNNGKIAPFADESQRRENGGITCNDHTQTPAEAAKDDFSVFRKMKCSDQLSTGVMSYIGDINNRRIFAVDEELGLVMAFSIFRHTGEPKVMKIIGVPGVKERKNDYGPFDLPAAHVFKIRNGKFYEIEAIGYMEKHGITNGWQ